MHCYAQYNKINIKNILPICFTAEGYIVQKSKSIIFSSFVKNYTIKPL